MIWLFLGIALNVACIAYNPRSPFAYLNAMAIGACVAAIFQRR